MDIDDTTKEYFRRGTKLFYENAEKVPLTEAYVRILALFLHQGKELRNGAFVPLLPPADELPTLSQYRYWYRMRPDLARLVASGKGSQPCTAGERAALEQLRQTNFGPGCQYVIHVVIGDIYLVSRLDRRRILGRPVIYIIVDIFSDLIVGMSVSLEGPSRQGAMLALENMAHDKVAYCREYGVDITEDAWPSHHLPKTIVANRSDLLLKNADALVNALDIEISNAQPCRLDWRESFERCFPLLDDTTIYWMPGSVNSSSEMGRKVHRLDGRLTLHEFRRLVIECIIEHNMAHRLSDDDLDGDMIADGVEPYPRDVWIWGIQNRVGALRTLPIDDVRRNLLPHANASATLEGVYFRWMLYTCGSAIQEQWFEQMNIGMKKSLTISIVFDPRTADRIYVLRPQEGQALETCRLLDKDEAKFEGCDWFDVEDVMERHRNEMDAETKRRQMFRELCAAQDHISDEGKRGLRKVLEDHRAEKEQEQKSITRDFQESEAPSVGHSHSTFKGFIERTFAQDNDKLFH